MSEEESYQKTFKTWDTLAGLYTDKFMDLDLYDESYDAFCDLIHNPNATLFEVACGPGNISRYLLQKNPFYRLFGIDVAPSMIDLARKNCPEARFEVMDCRTISSMNEVFEGIVCGFCIPYLTPKDLQIFILDCSLLLKNEGVFYLSYVEGNDNYSDLLTGSNGKSMLFHYYKQSFLENLVKNAGFSLIKKFELTYLKSNKTEELHVVLILRKNS